MKRSISVRRLSDSLPTWVARVPLAVWALLAGALALRLAIALRDLDVVDRLFIPDDTYYTLSIARSMAGGIGPSVDGVHLTNGFQPLIAFLLVPAFAVSSNPDVGLRAALVLLSVVDVANAALLGALAHRLGGRPAAILAVALWAFSPVAIGNALNGLETSLAVLCQLALVAAWWCFRDTGAARWAVLAGAAAGLALLARIDSVFLVAAFGLFEFLRGSWRSVAMSAATAVLVVAPWWLYSLARFGSPIPKSGDAVLEIVRIHRNFYLDVPEQLGWAAGSVLGAPFVDSAILREDLYSLSALGVLAWLVLVAVMGLALWWLGALRRDRLPLLGLGVHALAVLTFYTLVMSAVWFFGRYLAPVQAAVTLLIAVGAAALWRRRSRVAPRIGLAALAVLAAVSVVSSLSLLTTNPPVSPDIELHGAKGYREASRDILALAPDGAVIGSMQSGALNYYAGDRVRVVNLDGVVDQEAAEALHSGQLAAFARKRGVTYLADWPFNVALIAARSGDPNFQPERLLILGVSRSQGESRSQGGVDRFGLLALEHEGVKSTEADLLMKCMTPSCIEDDERFFRDLGKARGVGALP